VALAHASAAGGGGDDDDSAGGAGADGDSDGAALRGSRVLATRLVAATKTWARARQALRDLWMRLPERVDTARGAAAALLALLEAPWDATLVRTSRDFGRRLAAATPPAAALAAAPGRVQMRRSQPGRVVVHGR
jgi:hypothetical protein